MFEGRRRDFEHLVQRTIALSQPPDQAELRTLLAYARDDTAAQTRAVEALRDAPDEVVRVTAMRVALFDGDLRGAERISALLLDEERAPEFRVVGHLHLADLALAGGRRLEALEHIDSVSALIPAIGLEYRALHLLMPFAAATRAELLALRDALRRWDGESPATDFPMWRVYNGLHRHIRLYLLALVEARLGNLSEAAAHAGRLAQLRGGPDAIEWEGRAFALGLSESARGHIAAQRGDTAGALAHFERGRLRVSEGLLDAPFGSQPLDRFVRAELLRGSGAFDEARRWYSSLGETALHMIVFVGPVAERLRR
jgi:hypothetical protein